MEKRKRWLTAAMVVLILILAACVITIGNYYYQQYAAKQKYQELAAGEKTQQTEESKEEIEENTEEILEESVEIPIDFAELKEINPDVYAWIEIPGTDIAYPILQREDDEEYYINHNLDGSTGLPGVIFSQHFNKKDFSDFNTILYGHNMKDKTMFAQLHKFENPEFLEEHHQVIIYTPEHMYTYEIFAAVIYGDEHIMYRYDFSTEEGKTAFLDSIYNSRNMQNVYREEITAGTEDRVLTLVTCVAGVDEERFLVEAVLVDEK